MEHCQECGKIKTRRCPSCESVDADEMLREAREEGRREGLKCALRISADSASASEVWLKIVNILEAK